MLKKILVAMIAVFAFASAEEKPLVMASIDPLSYLVEQIAGDTVEVKTLAKSNVHSYDPSMDDMQNMSKAKIFFAVGLEYEKKWLKLFKESSKNLKIIETDDRIVKLKYPLPYQEKKILEEQGKLPTNDVAASGDRVDPHVWLNPMLVVELCRSITDGLIDVFPKNRDLYLANYRKFMQKVTQLDEWAITELEGLQHRKFLVYHTSWSYFARHFRLEEINLETEHDHLKMDDVASIVKMMKEENIKVIFIDSAHFMGIAKQLADQTGAKVEYLLPLTRDWLESIQNAVKVIKAANSAK